MHCPDNSATQANLEAVRDHVHLVFAPWLLSTPDPVKEFLAPGSAVVRRSLAKYLLAIDRDLLQCANQDTSYHASVFSASYKRKSTCSGHKSPAERRAKVLTMHVSHGCAAPSYSRREKRVIDGGEGELRVYCSLNAFETFRRYIDFSVYWIKLLRFVLSRMHLVAVQSSDCSGRSKNNPD